MRVALRLLTLLAVLNVAACSADPAPSLVTEPTFAAEPTVAVDQHGSFRLTFEVAQTRWPAGMPIVGEARLERLEAGQWISGSGGGPFTFSYRELEGTRRMDGEATADCGRHSLPPELPLTSGLQRSAGWSADDPNAGFYRQWVTSEFVWLPPGVWDVTAHATFSDGRECGQPGVALRATLKLEIVE